MEKTIYLDMDLCVGCGACVVACMDQNDIFPEMGQVAVRRIHRVEEGHFPSAGINYVSAACRHCEDAPCVAGCPTGAISKDRNTGSVVTARVLCIGCHSCAMVCPFGVPRYDAEDKLQKCGGCVGRVEAGLQPSCVRVCPTGALKFDVMNDLQSNKEHQYAAAIVSAVHRVAEQR
jgi:Fe-S-cluster-containing dehydrogenase component